MKKAILTIAIITATTIAALAQTPSASRGNWVVESNVHQPKIQTVKFYDADSQLLYTETINTRLNINRKKVQESLNKVLDSLVTKNSYAMNKNILAASFKLKK
jgi:hypothetical protein